MMGNVQSSVLGASAAESRSETRTVPKVSLILNLITKNTALKQGSQEHAVWLESYVFKTL